MFLYILHLRRGKFIILPFLSVFVGLVLFLWTQNHSIVQARSMQAESLSHTLRASQMSASAYLSCNNISIIPTHECTALVSFYQATNGPEWNNNENWLTIENTITPCDWYGITCESGHVTQVSLSGNGLKGSFPLSLSGLPQLRRILLANNLLTGEIPQNICDLKNTDIIVDIGYNGLFTFKRSVAECLSHLDRDWIQTQTVAPRDLQIAQSMPNALRLSWNPIPYIEGDGFYEVRYSTSVTGPFIVHGRTQDKSADGYLLDGLEPGQPYYIRVRTQTNAHDGQPVDLQSRYINGVGTTATNEKILVIVFFPADNNLSAYVDSVIRRFKIGTERNPNVQVVFFSDREGEANSEIVEISHGNIIPTNIVSEYWNAQELDSADPNVLSWFLTYARTNYPADRTIVSLMGHGIALAPEVVWPDTDISVDVSTPQFGIPILPQGMEATPGDVTNRGYMSTLDLGQALADATDNGNNPFDLLFLDQCFQGNLDVLYQIHQVAEVFVASPNYAWLIAAYDKYLPHFTPNATPEEMATAIIHIYQRSLNNHHPNSIFWVRGADIALIAQAVSNLGEKLLTVVRSGRTQPIYLAADNSKYADTTQCGRQNLKLGPPDELMGAGSFAQNLQRAFPAGDDSGVHQAADMVLTALENVKSTHRVGHPYLAPEEIWDYDDTLTILAPLARDSAAQVAWRASLYQDAESFNAVWNPDPSQTLTVTSNFAFVQDGMWDEFIHAWYPNPLAPTVGEWCHYIPPAVVISDTVEALDLTMQAATTADAVSIQLDWTESDEQNVTEYWIYAQGPHDVHRVLKQIVPAIQTDFSQTVLQSKLTSGASYRFAVVARVDEGDVVAQSNEITWTVPESEYQIYLPIVKR